MTLYKPWKRRDLLTLAAAGIALIACVVTAIQVLNQQHFQRKQMAYDIIRRNIDGQTADVLAAWSDFAYSGPTAQRAAFIDGHWDRTIINGSHSIDSIQYHSHVIYMLNMLQAQANAYNLHIVDRRLIWNEAHDALLTPNPRLDGACALDMIIDLLEQSKRWNTHLATLREFRKRLAEGPPTPVAEWLGFDDSSVTIGTVLVLIPLAVGLGYLSRSLGVIVHLPRLAFGHSRTALADFFGLLPPESPRAPLRDQQVVKPHE